MFQRFLQKRPGDQGSDTFCSWGLLESDFIRMIKLKIIHKLSHGSSLPACRSIPGASGDRDEDRTPGNRGNNLNLLDA